MCGEHAEGGEHCEHSEDGDHGEHSEDHFFSHCSPDGHITAARAVDRELCVYPLKGSLGIAHRGTNRAKILNFCSKTCFFDVLTLANALTDRNLQDGPGNFEKNIFDTDHFSSKSRPNLVQKMFGLNPNHTQMIFRS